ncbi:amidohydrolase family protein, partial [Myxococcota bacterium]|nr:amidohydrolase family protein [Myxococcota bacterium]
ACHGLFRGFAEDVGHLSSLSEHLWPLEAMLDPDSMRAAARLSFAEALLAGTTSVLDMGSVHHTDILFEEAARFGLRYMGGKAIMDQAQGLLPGLRESTDEALMASNRLCEKYNGAEGGRLRYAYSPRFILSSSQTAFSESAKEAKKRGAWLHTHAAESSEESQLVEQRTGSLPFDFLDSQGFLNEKTIVAHGVFMSMKERRTLKESGAALAHCPSSNLKLGSGIARVSDLVRVGVPVLLGSGGAAVNNRLDILEEARLACLLQRHRGNPGAVSAREALRWITIEGARALGLQEVGALIEGYHADILLLDSQSPHLFSIAPDIYSQIVFSGRGSDIHSVWVDGRPLVEDHTLLVDSERKILAEADRAARLLVSKISKI